MRLRVSAPLKEKIPTLLLEAFSVVLAVLLALAVDQWREDRGNRDLARLARDRITSELASNRAELEAAASRHQEILASLEKGLADLNELTTGQSWEMNFPIAILSSSAWQTAQATQAVHHLDFDWVVRVSKAHDVQELYLAGQARVVEHISSLDSGGTQVPASILGGLRSRIATVRDLELGLLEAYEDLLEPSSGGSG